MTISSHHHQCHEYGYMCKYIMKAVTNEVGIFGKSVITALHITAKNIFVSLIITIIEKI